MTVLLVDNLHLHISYDCIDLKSWRITRVEQIQEKKRQTGNREFVVNWALTQNQSEVAKMRTICSATRSEKSSCKSDNSKADGGFVEIMNVVNEQQKVEMV